jgi:hypothetical protein
MRTDFEIDNRIIDFDLEGPLGMWELCSGSKTVAQAFADDGWHDFTIDIEPKYDPDLVGNLLNYTYEELVDISGFHPDFIWFSPPCQTFSIANCKQKHFAKKNGSIVAQTHAAQDAIAFVQHGIDIMNASKASYALIENPRALLRTQSLMKQFPRYTVTYCQYGKEYQKPTDLWGWLPPGFEPRACCQGDPCHVPAPRGSTTGLAKLSAHERGIVPYDLALELAKLMRENFPVREVSTLERWI